MKKLFVFLAASVVSASIIAQSASPPVFQVRLVADAPSADTEQRTLITTRGDQVHREVLNVQKTVLLDQKALKSAELSTDVAGHPIIDITFTDTGRKQFANVTRQRIGKRLAIVMDGRLCAAPVIRTEISGGKAQISSDFSKEEATSLAKQINDAVQKQ